MLELLAKAGGGETKQQQQQQPAPPPQQPQKSEPTAPTAEDTEQSEAAAHVDGEVFAEQLTGGQRAESSADNEVIEVRARQLLHLRLSVVVACCQL